MVAQLFNIASNMDLSKHYSSVAAKTETGGGEWVGRRGGGDNMSKSSKLQNKSLAAVNY